MARSPRHPLARFASSLPKSLWAGIVRTIAIRSMLYRFVGDVMCVFTLASSIRIAGEHLSGPSMRARGSRTYPSIRSRSQDRSTKLTPVVLPDRANRTRSALGRRRGAAERSVRLAKGFGTAMISPCNREACVDHESLMVRGDEPSRTASTLVQHRQVEETSRWITWTVK